MQASTQIHRHTHTLYKYNQSILCVHSLAYQQQQKYFYSSSELKVKLLFNPMGSTPKPFLPLAGRNNMSESARGHFYIRQVLSGNSDRSCLPFTQFKNHSHLLHFCWWTCLLTMLGQAKNTVLFSDSVILNQSIKLFSESILLITKRS